MNIKNTYLGVRAYLKLSKDERKAFHKLPKHYRKTFFQLGETQREQFLLFVEVLSQNAPANVNKKVRTISKHTGAPAVEYHEHLTLESKRQTSFALRKIENITADPNIKTKEQQTDIVTMTSAREMRERFHLLNEQMRLEQNNKRSRTR